MSWNKWLSFGKRAPEEPAWRVEHVGRSGVRYEERLGDEWRGFVIDGEGLIGQPAFIIHFGSLTAWSSTPAWAQSRREEIVNRVKTACPVPRYGYRGELVMNDGDWHLLAAAEGGTSENTCAMGDCKERALNGKAFCVRHGFPELT